MLAHIILLPDLFLVARGLISSDLFMPSDEAVERLAWETAIILTDQFNSPDVLTRDIAKVWNMMEVTASAHAAAHPKDFTAQTVADAFSRDPDNPGLFFWLFKPETRAELDAEFGNKLMARFLRERKVMDTLLNVITSAQGAIINNLSSIMGEVAADEAQINQLNYDPVESGAPEGWMPKPLGKYPTGIDFLDPFLNGGHAPRETYGVLGAFGSGKTTLAIELVAYSGLYQQELESQVKKKQRENPGENIPDYLPGDCYMFHYECGGDEIKTRLWSLVAEISRNSLEEFDYSKLSSTGSLKKYELERWSETIQKNGILSVLGEKERLLEAQRKIRRNMWFVDMSGVPNNPKQGTGYVPEISDIIARHQMKLNRLARDEALKNGKNPDLVPKHHVSVVVIDYAGLCCRRHLRANNLPDQKLRHLVSEFGDQCRIHIADRFNTPVWIMHQLSGEANKRTHATKQVHADAAESKGFAENLWFCFTLGTKDETHNVLYFNCSKARRSPGGKAPLVKVDGEFGKLVLAKGYRIGVHGRVEKDETIKTSTNGRVAVMPAINIRGNGSHGPGGDPYSYLNM